MTGNTSRDVDAVLGARYWLTPAGYAVLEQLERQQQDEQ